MFVTILISAAVLILLSGIILAIKYYKIKRWPLYRAFGKRLKEYKKREYAEPKPLMIQLKNSHNTQNN